MGNKSYVMWNNKVVLERVLLLSILRQFMQKKTLNGMLLL